MPLYAFHIARRSDEDEVIEIHIDDDEQARLQAIQLAGEMLKSEPSTFMVDGWLRIRVLTRGETCVIDLETVTARSADAAAQRHTRYAAVGSR